MGRIVADISKYRGAERLTKPSHYVWLISVEPRRYHFSSSDFR
jgi:hypothetical protein